MSVTEESQRGGQGPFGLSNHEEKLIKPTINLVMNTELNNYVDR